MISLMTPNVLTETMALLKGILLTLNHVDFCLNVQCHTSVPTHNQPQCTKTPLSLRVDSFPGPDQDASLNNIISTKH